MQINFLHQLAAGGTGIWVIAALSLLAIAVALERLHRFRPSAVVPPALVDQAVPLWQAGRFDELEALLQRHDSVLARTLRLLAAQRTRWPADALAARASESASRALRAEQQRAYPLAVVATVAPIVGLLGTVVGMIEAFHVIAFSGGLGDAALLAGGISKALVNTAAGLSVALPSLALHHFFRHRLVLCGLAMEEELERLLDACVRPPATGGR
ncbi:MotA/TolQ/ExbB proton channel family protein [Aquabacterium sp.]|uniref:MotA/TolQ/ExbB proton channel family protein n=1 Tax=Aquabacterium sp. TaxID=1872578 RepID=UPI002C41780D|nr:MotA/TolQ/ExbB proton channel family protein [Aquabacterium sp.]HSW03067.1 MotA/TolQ/ExbB proton channel family protein [Aquabacterium sp.]